MNIREEHQKGDDSVQTKILIEELPIIFEHHDIQVTATYLKTINRNEN